MAFVPSTAPTLILSSGLSHVCSAHPTLSSRHPSFLLARPRRHNGFFPSRTTPTPQPTSTTTTVPNMTMMSSTTSKGSESSSAARKFMVGGNWKCNLSKGEIQQLVDSFNAGPALDADAIEVVVAPPAVYLDSTRAALRQDFATCAQNCWIKEGGAYTGELDAKMVADVRATWCLLGHSERRHLPQIKETDADIATKARYAVTQAGLQVMFCIGELLDEREAGQTLSVCQRQLQALADAIGSDTAIWDSIVIAYEPVWAIGTGKVATPDQAEEVHNDVRQWLNDNVSPQVAASTRILYGGSVSPANCEELAKKPNVDGFLVGGASLKPTFLEIVDSYKAAIASTV